MRRGPLLLLLAMASLSAARDPAWAQPSIQETMFSKMAPERRELLSKKVKVFLVPARRKILEEIAVVLQRELPTEEAKTKIGEAKLGYDAIKRAPGTRVPSEPRGFTAGYQLKDGWLIFCFVGEENVSAWGEWDETGSRTGRVMVHELAHAVFKAALSEVEHEELKRLCIEYNRKNPSRTYAYEEGDEDELFAELVEVWFGVHQTGLNQKGWDTSEPFVHLAPLMRFIEKIFGPSRNVR